MFIRTTIICFLISSGYSQRKAGDKCTDKYTNTIGRCVLARTCQSAREDFHNNGIQPTFCVFDDLNSLVCCRDGSSIFETGPSNPVSQNPSTNNNRRKQPQNDNKRISERKCEEYSRGVTETVDFLPLLPDPETMSISAAKCNYEKVELIVGGKNTEVGEFPHMAAIGWPAVAGGYLFKCGGSLISERFVLTAGHCLKNPRDPTVSDPKPTVVRLGDQNIDPKVNDGANPIEVPIKALHKHPDYKPPKQYNDLALVELASDVDFETNIRAACLWNRHDFGGQISAVATGWGVTDTRTLESSNDLQKVSLSLFTNEYCDNLLKLYHNRKWSGLTTTQMCAGEMRGGKDTCQGDSGGPLQFASKENQCVFHIVGVTSFGIGCAKSGQPAIYTRVSSYIDWIESIVWPNGA